MAAVRAESAEKEKNLHTVPHSVEAEEALLGSVFIDPEEFENVRHLVSPDDFYIVRHGWIWSAMLAVRERGDEIDYVSINDQIRAMGKSEECPPVFLTHLINRTPSGLYAATYAQIVKRAALRRRMLVAASEIAKLAYAEDRDVFEVINEAQAAIAQIQADGAERSGTKSIEETLSSVFDSLTEKPETVSTGFTDLDALLGGMQSGDLAVIAGRPGMGKTSLLLTIAQNVAKEGCGNVVYFSLEMSAEQITQRLISANSGVPVKALRSRTLNDEQLSRVTSAISELSRLPLVINDLSNLTVNRIGAILRGVENPRLVIVDYVQLVQVEPETIKTLRLSGSVDIHSYISRSLKALARSFNVPVLIAAQLNRQVEAEREKRPRLAHLRSSGAYEQDADFVLFVYRDEVYNQNTTKPNVAEIIVAKNRHGETGTAELYFERERMRFANMMRQAISLEMILGKGSSSKKREWIPVATRKSEMERTYDDNTD